MNNFKNIIFDFGNVLLDLDMSATEKQLTTILGSQYSHSEQNNSYPSFFEEYESGKMTEEDFLTGLEQMAGGTSSRTVLKSAWNAMLGPISQARLDMLLQLRKDYRVFLLSNTNKTHIDYVMAYLKKAHNIEDWDSRYFEKTYYSHLVKMRKPDAEIYNFVVADADLNPSETLFIDDNPANIKTADMLGWQTILHNDGRDITEVMQPFLK